MCAQPLVACIPNFSEGRNLDTVTAIVDMLWEAGKGKVNVLDVSSNADHNRSVVTLAGTPVEMEEALFAAIQKAAELIDMEHHRGEHPRFGATDVVPFVPIQGITMEDCVAMARRLGKRVGAELHIPVFLYEHAATRPERENLAKIRSNTFQFEQLRTTIAGDSRYTPDFGPAVVGKAGATIIGARAPLIAFNVYLTTDNVEIARKIAVAVRESSGGYAFVKAAGFLVDGKAQVSMNLTNHEKTPIFRVVETIRREAQRYGVGILSTELVGLTPQAALIDSARWYLQLDGFKSDQIMEMRLVNPDLRLTSQEKHSDQSQYPSSFLEKVAAGTPTPGGGSVAALAGALAAALTEMVARLTVGKKAYAEVTPQMYDIAEAAAGLRQRLLESVLLDAQVFEDLMAASKLPKEEPKRDAIIADKTWKAAEVPFQVCSMGVEVLHLAKVVAQFGNKNASTDAAAGAYMAVAAIEGAALNVRVNLTNIEASGQIEETYARLDHMLEEAHALRREILEIVESRSGISSRT